MRLHVLEREQRLPVPLAQAWDFFSDPRNLARITPSHMRLELLSHPPERIYPGLLITYRLRPLWGVPVTWVNQITHVEAPNLFVDEQRSGPYRFFHHQHLFRGVAGGTEMRDIVHYAVPRLAGPARRLLVAPRLQALFDHRRRALEEIFGVSREPLPPV